MKKILLIGGAGYIGSYLFDELKRKYIVDVVDNLFYPKDFQDLNLISQNIKYRLNYQELPSNFYEPYDSIILLAGHSSVKMAENDMIGSFENNVQNFVNLLSKINGHQKLIYASSSSVYGDTGNSPASETWDRFRPKSYYDLTKQIIDFYAEMSGVQYYGLRFGTVNGWAPHVRSDIMLNKMFFDAKNFKEIKIFNSHISRPILGINDLCRSVLKIIDSDNKKGIYNLASFNITVGELAKRFKFFYQKHFHDTISVVDMGNVPAYNFSVDCSKFEENFDFKFSDTIEDIVQSFVNPCVFSSRNFSSKLFQTKRVINV